MVYVKKNTNVGLNGGEAQNGRSLFLFVEDRRLTYIAVKGAALEDKKQQLAPWVWLYFIYLSPTTSRTEVSFMILSKLKTLN